MPEPEDIDEIGNADELSIGAEDDGVLDASDTLDGNPGDDPLDPGVLPPDRWSAGEGYGNTLSEEEAGESLDQLLAEEEPDVDPYAEAGREAEEASEDEAATRTPRTSSSAKVIPKIRARAVWWPRTKARIRMRRPISSPATSASTLARPAPRRPPSTSKRRTAPNAAPEHLRSPAVATGLPPPPAFRSDLAFRSRAQASRSDLTLGKPAHALLSLRPLPAALRG
jgi:hypothetical protein